MLAQFTNLFALVLLGASGSMPASLRICHTVGGVTFAAGAGAGSGTARKDSVDPAACVLMADAAERARYPYRPQPALPG